MDIIERNYFPGLFVALIYLFHMDTLIFIINKGLNIAIIAAIIIFQPELRKALEILGRKCSLSTFSAVEMKKMWNRDAVTRQ
ncbi:MAG: hypothetical protein V8T31_11430 [Lachnospiraceae bacterium]